MQGVLVSVAIRSRWWWVVPFQLKQGGQYLDAAYCGKTITLNGSLDYAGGACQLWRLVPVGGGWSRLQLKQGGQI